MKTIEVRLVQGKEIKGTYRFEAEDPQAAITTLYIAAPRGIGRGRPGLALRGKRARTW